MKGFITVTDQEGRKFPIKRKSIIAIEYDTDSLPNCSSKIHIKNDRFQVQETVPEIIVLMKKSLTIE